VAILSHADESESRLEKPGDAFAHKGVIVHENDTSPLQPSSSRLLGNPNVTAAWRSKKNAVYMEGLSTEGM
jgi:hypothetical protein